MLAALGIAARFVGGLFTSALSALAKYLGYIFAYRLGKRAAQQDQLEHDAEVKDEQLDIAARSPKHRRGLLDRMRSAKRNGDGL